MQRRDRIVLNKILAEIDIGEEMMGNAELEHFLQDEKLKRASSMTIINVGELVKLITEETRSKYPDVPWEQIAGMRDITAHKYQTLRMEDVYQTIKQDFPDIRTRILRILEEGQR